LFDVGEVLESQRARSNIEQEIGRFNDAFEHFTLKDCDNAFTSKSRQDEDQVKNIDDSNNVYLKSDNSTSNEQVGKQCFLNTPLNFVTNSKAKYNP